jgi:GntP family gluconate:H+ symporter
VAATKDYVDKVTGKAIAKVTTGQIYWGAVAFVIIQVLMVGLVIAFPGIVSGGLAKKADVNVDKIQIEVPDAIKGQGGKAQDEMEDALDKALGGEEGKEAEPGKNENDK